MSTTTAGADTAPPAGDGPAHLERALDDTERRINDLDFNFMTAAQLQPAAQVTGSGDEEWYQAALVRLRRLDPAAQVCGLGIMAPHSARFGPPTGDHRSDPRSGRRTRSRLTLARLVTPPAGGRHG